MCCPIFWGIVRRALKSKWHSKHYDYVRVPRASKVVAMSREQGRTLDMESDIGDDIERLAESLRTKARIIWDEDLKFQLFNTMQKFEELRN